MTVCNKCGGRMVPSTDALVAALACEGCGRVIPRTAARPPKGDRRQLSRALRAARRAQLKEAR